MSTNWKDKWETVGQQSDRGGGQGTVTQVRRKSDGYLGALKRLHPEHLRSKERRFRMQQEVNALRVLDGNGTPVILDTNTELWEATGTPLYVIMDWIEGVTLNDFVQGHLISLDDALVVIRSLSDTLYACHRLDIFHRDLKPDNIIFGNNNIANPIIIDFGMAWSKPSEDELREFRTAAGQELGNRFLRLPEYAPNRHIHDARSDLTMVVGLLFFMITGRAPRILVDADGRMPHEALAQYIPECVLKDPRWPTLGRLFRVGFQTRLDLRFQSSEQLRASVETLMAFNQQNEELVTVKLERLEHFLNFDQVRLPKLAKEEISKVTDILLKTFISNVSKASFLGSGQWSPVDARSELGSNFSYHIYKKGNRSGGMLKCAGKARAENTQKKPFFCHASLLDMKWSTQISQKVLSTLCAKADFSRVSAWLSPPERLPKKMTHLNWWPGLTIQLGFGTLCM